MYILYKKPIQLLIIRAFKELIRKARYKHNIHLTPTFCIERNYPQNVTDLPSIYCNDNKRWYYGLDECVNFYENKSNIHNLLYKSEKFKEQNPEYRIKDTGRPTRPP